MRDNRTDYLAIPASSTKTPFGSNKNSEQVLVGLLIVPATTSPGAVSIYDGTGSAMTVFTGGATSVADLKSFFIPLGIRSNSGTNGTVGWQITTGTNVSVIAIGSSI